MSKPAIIVVGQLPPPIHGQSVVIERITNLQTDLYTIISLPLNCSSEIESVGKFQFKKILTTLQVAYQLGREARKHTECVVYYPPASPHPIPVVRDMLFFLVARMSVRSWVFHLHAGGLPEFLSAGTVWSGREDLLSAAESKHQSQRGFGADARCLFWR